MWIIGGNATVPDRECLQLTDGNHMDAVDSSADWDARSGLCSQSFLNKILYLPDFRTVLLQ
jgi:hypothetical protein